MNRTVLRSSGTVVPPDVTQTILRGPNTVLRWSVTKEARREGIVVVLADDIVALGARLLEAATPDEDFFFADILAERSPSHKPKRLR